MPWFVIIPVIVVVLALIAAGYVKAPPDTAYIISGFRKPRILIGKAGIRIPFLERMDKLSLKMFSVDVKTTDYVPNAEYINVKVDATVKIRIGQSEEMMKLASMYGKHTYTEIAAEIGRSQGGIYRVVKMLKERGVI